MAFKSFPVALGATDTDVFECPAATEAAVVLLVSNVSGGALTYTLKFYKASTDTTTTVISGKSLAANTAEKVPAPISMEAGDKIVMLCSSANNIVVGGTVTIAGTVQVISTFVPEGEWDDETTYTANISIVSRNGNSYLARPNESANLDQDPATAADFWMLLAEKGTTGDGDLSAANNLSDLASASEAFDNIKQAATDEYAGVVELATAGETEAQSDTGRAVVPAGLVNFLKGNAEDQTSITGGAGVTSKDLGTLTTGTLTVDLRDRPVQRWVNGGAHTLAVEAHDGWSIVYITNDASAGTITLSSITRFGDAFTTTDGHIFRCSLERVNGTARLFVKACQ